MQRFGTIVNKIGEDELVTSQALLELHEELGEVEQDLSDEITRATGAEGHLQDEINQLTSAMTSGTGELIQALQAEIERATSAETELGEAIEAETERATGVEDELRELIEAEASARTEADQDLQDQIDELASVVASGNTELEELLNAEIERATGAEETLANAINGLEIVKVTTGLSSNVKEAYKLVNSASTQLGETINIYKDSSLYTVYLGHVDDALVDPASPEHTDGTGDTALCFIYLKSDSTYELVAVDVESFLEESEFGDGLMTSAHVVSVKIDETSEEFLTVSEDGLKLSGVQDAIDSAATELREAIEAETERAVAREEELSNAIDELAGIVASGNTELEELLNAEIERATGVEDELRGLIEAEASARTEADQDLQEQIDELAGIVASGNTELEELLNAEIERATSAETDLSDAIEAEASARTEADQALQEQIDDALTEVTVNGKTATTANTVITLDGTDIEVGDEIDYSGVTIITEDSTVAEAFETLVDKMVENELVTSQALLELHEELGEVEVALSAETERAMGVEEDLQNQINDINDIIGGGTGATLTSRISALEEGLANEIERATGREDEIEDALSAETERALGVEEDLQDQIDDRLSTVTVNGHEATTANTVITLDGADVNVGGDIEYSGEEFITEGTSVSGAFATVVDKIEDNERHFQEAIDDINEIIGLATGETLSSRITALEEGLAEEIETARSAETILAQAIDDVNDELTEKIEGISLELYEGVLPSNVREAYVLLDSEGEQKGEMIKIYNDSSLYRTYLGHVDDELESTGSTEIVEGSGDTALCFIYHLDNDTYELVSINVESFLEEAEFQDGLEVSNHVVKVKIDSHSEEYISVSEGGILLTGIDAAIASASTEFGEALAEEIQRATDAEQELNNAITGETERAEAAEQALDDKIEDEEERAKGVEEELNNAISAETERAEAEEAELWAAISAETERAMAKESELSDAIDELAGIVASGNTELEEALNAEIERATGKEGEIENALSAETERAIAAEEDLQDQINNALTEVSVNGKTATTATTSITLDGTDLVLGEDVDYEALNIISGDSTVTEAFGTIVNKIGEDELVTSQALLELHEELGEVEQDLSDEITRATGAEGHLQDEINQLTSAMTSGTGELIQALQAEIERATSAETELGEAIEAETERATGVEDELRELIEAEASARTEADQDLQDQIDELASVVASGNTELEELLNAEIERATGAEETLANAINGLEIVKVTTGLSSNVKEAYKLVNSASTQLGETINIYKDSSLYTVYLGHVDDALVDPASPEHTDGTGDAALCFIYLKTDGTYELVAVDVESFLEESEFGNGLQVTAHVVSVKIDENSEEYLTVSENGISLNGIDAALDELEDAIDELASIVASGNTELEEALNAEISARTEADQALQSQIDEKLSEVTVNGKTATTANTVITLDAGDILVGNDIVYSGDTYISGDDTLNEALSTIVNEVIEDEQVVSAALLELHDDVNSINARISGMTGFTTMLTGVTVNGNDATVSDNVASVDINSDDILMASDIVKSGITVSSSASSITETFEAIVDEMVNNERVVSAAINDLNNRMEDNNWVVAAAFNDMNYRMLSQENLTLVKNGTPLVGTATTAMSQTESGQTVRTGTKFEVASNASDVRTTAQITVNSSNPLYSTMASAFDGGVIPAGTTLQEILTALFS